MSPSLEITKQVEVVAPDYRDAFTSLALLVTKACLYDSSGDRDKCSECLGKAIELITAINTAPMLKIKA